MSPVFEYTLQIYIQESVSPSAATRRKPNTFILKEEDSKKTPDA
jgi:hypothetical protein